MTNGGQMVKVPEAGEVSREDFGGRQLEARAETASTALAAQAKAAVEARYLMALHKPRDIAKTKEALIRECKRPGFAKAAEYLKPIGKGVTGPSIRLAEAAARAMGNIDVETMTIYDDNRQRIIKVVATDLESNVKFDKSITVPKRVERSNADGRTVISSRQNSKGFTTYLVEATDDEMLNTENALISKALRTILLRLVPGDIIDDAIDTARETRRKEKESDLPREREGMVKGFSRHKVTRDDLVEYLGHRIEDCTAEELDHMEMVFNTINDGESTWKETIAAKREERSRGTAAVQAQAPAGEQPATKPEPAKDAKPATLADAAAKAKEKRLTIEMPGGERTPGEEG